ncbi:MAG: DUF378 domain-containing protein [Polyangiaceae bacterium]
MSTTTITPSGGGLTGLTWVAVALVVIGAINWGLIGIFNYNLVAALFGVLSPVSRIIYILVALAGLYLLVVSFGRLREVRHPRTTATTSTS